MHAPASSIAGGADADTAFDEHCEQLIVEQFRGLRYQLLLVVLFMATLAWSAVPAPWVVVWGICAMLAREWRGAYLLASRRSHSLPMASRLKRIVQSSFVTGIAHGAAALFMLWTDTTIDAVLTLVLMSLVAAAASTNSMVPPAFIVYAGCVCVLTAVSWIARMDLLGWSIGVLSLLFLGVQSRFAQGNYRTLKESFDIRRENETLADRLRQEQRELAIARDIAVRANQEKSRFLASASHDLRQPLQSLLLNSGELLRLQISDDARLIGGDIATSVEELRGMLDAFLDVSKLDADAVIPMMRPISLNRLVERVVAGFRPAAIAKGLQLQVISDGACHVRIDPDLLRRVLANLIDNSIKFTDRGVVSVELRNDVDGQVRLCVADTGIGISAEHHTQIFEDLVQLGNPQRSRHKGHGLGLGIVRRLVRLLDLELSVESSPGHGSRFCLMLQSAPEPREEVEEPSIAAPSQRLDGFRILVVDDDSMVRGALYHALSSIGCKVRTVASGDEAIEACESLDAQAILVDWRLADSESGFDVIRRVRQLRPDMPAVMVSADADEQLRSEAATLRIEVLRKPIDIDAMARGLRAAMKVGTGDERRSDSSDAEVVR